MQCKILFTKKLYFSTSLQDLSRFHMFKHSDLHFKCWVETERNGRRRALREHLGSSASVAEPEERQRLLQSWAPPAVQPSFSAPGFVLTKPLLWLRYEERGSECLCRLNAFKKGHRCGRFFTGLRFLEVLHLFLLPGIGSWFIFLLKCLFIKVTSP